MSDAVSPIRELKQLMKTNRFRLKYLIMAREYMMKLLIKFLSPISPPKTREQSLVLDWGLPFQVKSLSNMVVQSRLQINRMVEPDLKLGCRLKHVDHLISVICLLITFSPEMTL